MEPNTNQVAQRIKEFNRPLLPDKVQLKYKALTQNPYRFFRGTCHLFYEDLSTTAHFTTSPVIWACGDLHLENFGSYKGNNRYVYFDITDFDEALLAPVTWELARITTSMFIAFNALAVKEEKAIKWVTLFLDVYYKVLLNGKAKHIEARLARGIVKKFLEIAAGRKQKTLLKKHIIKKHLECRLLIDKEHQYAIDEVLKTELMIHIGDWINHRKDYLKEYKAIDACFRVAGTGSLGVKRYVFLLRHFKREKDFLLVEMKESRPSCLLPYVPVQQPQWNSEAQREVTIQSGMQYTSAALLDTTLFKSTSFTIQEMQPSEDKIDFTQISKQPKYVSQVLNDMALLTASAQLRSSGRQGSAIADELVAFGEVQKSKQELIDYAFTYARKVQMDYAGFLSAYKSGFFKNS